MTTKRCLILVALVLFALPAWAETESDIGWVGWGLRVGLADDPDQVVGGIQFNLGTFTRQIRFQPDFQVGFGDDAKTYFFTVPAYYRFRTDQHFTPYAGGGPTFGWFDPDKRSSDFEAGLKATGGLEWPTKSGGAFFVELSLGFGDVHDVSMVAAWNF